MTNDLAEKEMYKVLEGVKVLHFEMKLLNPQDRPILIHTYNPYKDNIHEIYYDFLEYGTKIAGKKNIVMRVVLVQGSGKSLRILLDTKIKPTLMGLN